MAGPLERRRSRRRASCARRCGRPATPSTPSATCSGSRATRSPCRAGQVPVVDRQLPRGEPLPTLVRLFLLAVPVPVAEAAAALGTLSVERCAGFGVVERRGRPRRARRCRLLPARDVVVVCDRKHEYSAELSADHVMSVTPSTNLLADLTIRTPVGERARRLHRRRPAGAALRAPRAPRRRHRPQPARAQLRRLRRRAERARQHRVPRGRHVRAGRRRALRPRRLEPAVHHLARLRVRVPRQPAGGRRDLAPRRARRRRAPARRRARVRARRAGAIAATSTGPSRSRAWVDGHRLRRLVPAPHLGRPARLRRRLQPAAGARRPGRLRGGDRPLARLRRAARATRRSATAPSSCAAATGRTGCAPTPCTSPTSGPRASRSRGSSPSQDLLFSLDGPEALLDLVLSHEPQAPAGAGAAPAPTTATRSRWRASCWRRG